MGKIEGAKHLLGIGKGDRRTVIKRIEDISKEKCESLYGGHSVETSKGTKVCLFVTDEKGTPVVAEIDDLGKGMADVTPQGGRTRRVEVE